MRNFILIICVLSIILPTFANCSRINNLYENRENGTIKTKKHKFLRKSKSEEKQDNNTQIESPFVVFPQVNSNSQSNVYIWKHEP